MRSKPEQPPPKRHGGFRLCSFLCIAGVVASCFHTFSEQTGFSSAWRFETTTPWPGWNTTRHTFLRHVSPESVAHVENAKLRTTDVVIVTFPKTGTTWLQQICEQMRTGGDMKFSEITERQPWLEFAYDCGQDLNADQVAFPRLFKSHQLLSAVNPGAKYLSMVRSPEDVLKSWFAFEKGKGYGPYRVFRDFNEYAASGRFTAFRTFGANLWRYYVELWEARFEPNVLVLCHERLSKGDDVKPFLREIARFLEVEANESRVAMVERMSSRAFMLEHADHFNDNFLHENANKTGKSRRRVEKGSKVTVSNHGTATAETKEILDRNWDRLVREVTGLDDYGQMCDGFVQIARRKVSGDRPWPWPVPLLSPAQD